LRLSIPQDGDIDLKILAKVLSPETEVTEVTVQFAVLHLVAQSRAGAIVVTRAAMATPSLIPRPLSEKLRRVWEQD